MIFHRKLPAAGNSKSGVTLVVPEEKPLRQARFREFTSYALVVAALAVSAGGMLARNQIPFSSDQAISALMGLEIRDKGVHPAFYWGVQYGGSLEPHILSIVFRLFPPTVLAYRLTMFCLLGISIGLIAAATARVFDRLSGVLAGLYLALGPSFLFFKALSSDGAYASFLATIASALFFATWLAQARQRWKVLAALLALGTSIGLAWWILPHAIVLVPVVALPILREPRLWLRPVSATSFLAGFTGGSLPWWIENFRTGFASLKSAELAPAQVADSIRQFAVLVKWGLPVLLGGRSPGARIPSFPESEEISLGLLLLMLAVAISLVASEKRRDRRFLAMASLAFLVLPAALSLTVARTNLREDPRYLIATYLGLASLSGIFLSRLWKRGKKLPALLLALVLLLLGPLSQFRSPSYRNDPRHGKIPETIEAARTLEADGVREIYTGYWTAYRLDFLSGGRIVASPFGEGAEGPARSLSALHAVDASTRPAFLIDPAAANRLEAFLQSRAAPYEARFIDAFELVLVTGVPTDVLADLRRCRCLSPAPRPLPSDASRMSHKEEVTILVSSARGALWRRRGAVKPAPRPAAR